MRCFRSWLLGNLGLLQFSSLLIIQKYSWLIFTFCGVQFLSAQTTQPYLKDFESSEGYSLGGLNAQNGWVRNQGQATINSGTALSGDNFVALVANNPFSQVSIMFNSMGRDEINFVDFYLKLKAGSEGEVYVFDGDGVGGGECSRQIQTTV